MKREIKFRAWHIEHKQMFWWDVLWGNHRQGDGYIGMVLWGEKQTRHIHRDNMTLIDPNDCELMQFTGLKDKNGREIYEGDIVAHAIEGYTTPLSVVEFKDGMFVFTDSEYSTELIESLDYCEVIGNIYENPELLKA
jgi:uncharacterized phage protein (TIGR01671 family)